MKHMISDYDKLLEVLSKSNEVELNTKYLQGINDNNEETLTKLLIIKVMGESIEVFFDEKDNIL